MEYSANTSAMLNHIINKMSSDMKFVGIFYIIVGALYCLSIIGAVVGIPLIISGLRVRESADSFLSYMMSGDTAMLENALERQSKFFLIQKIFIIISIVLFVLYIFVIIAFSSFFFETLNSSNYPSA